MTDPAPQTPLPAPSPHRRLYGVAALLLCALLGVWLFVPDLIRAKTDDAYVEAHIEPISARVAGYVLALHIDDNSKVTRGQTLVELDPVDFQVKVDRAGADLAAAESLLEESHAKTAVAATAVGETAAEAEAANANATLAAADLKRFEGVSDVRAVSSERLDAARANAEATRAALSAAKAKIAQARAQQVLAELQERTAAAAVGQAKASLVQLRLDLSHTKVLAPEDGSVARKLVEAGSYVQPGQTLLSLVPADLFIIANFKETQLDGIEVGSAVKIRVDALPGQILHGHVDSLQRGSGARFALLPPENATGNFVKIAQRVPVKIRLDEPPEALAKLSPGLSAVVSVRHPGAPSWLGLFD